MTLDEMAPKNTVATNWIIAVSITVFVFPFIALLSIITVIPSFIALIPLFIGAPYFIFVAIYSALKSKKEVPEGLVLDDNALKFGTVRQQITLLTNIILLINLVGWVRVIFFDDLSTPGFIVVVLTGFLGLLSIIVNSPLIYGKFYWSERIARRDRLEKWKLIRISRILCWIVWSIYALISLSLAFGSIFSDVFGEFIGVMS